MDNTQSFTFQTYRDYRTMLGIFKKWFLKGVRQYLKYLKRMTVLKRVSEWSSNMVTFLSVGVNCIANASGGELLYNYTP